MDVRPYALNGEDRCRAHAATFPIACMYSIASQLIFKGCILLGAWIPAGKASDCFPAKTIKGPGTQVKSEENGLLYL